MIDAEAHAAIVGRQKMMITTTLIFIKSTFSTCLRPIIDLLCLFPLLLYATVVVVSPPYSKNKKPGCWPRLDLLFEKGVFHTNFGITAPEILISPEFSG